MSNESKVNDNYTISSKFKASIWLKVFFILLSIGAVVIGLIIGLQLFEALGEFKRLGIIIILGSIVGAVLLLAIVKILNDLAYIKNRLDKMEE
jgi:uncharacterized membrane protein YeaQ/YmgE (transglycosylase-associated protein family)